MKRLVTLFALSIVPVLAFAAAEGEGAAAERLLPTPAGVLPIVEEPVTLKVFVAPAPFIGDFNTNKATIYWEGMTGVNIEWIQVPAQDKQEKLSLMLSSGSDLPDIISTPLSFEQVILYGAQGLFIPLNDLIDEYGHGIRTLRLSELPVRSLSLRPGNSPTTLYGGRVNGLQIIGFPPPCHPSYGALALTPAGLSPAERASLCWTHIRTCALTHTAPTFGV